MNKKISVKNPFCSGEYVVYPAHGVGKVADITKQNVAGSELELIVVNFDKDKMTLRIPMAKAETTGLRKISGADTMNDALTVCREAFAEYWGQRVLNVMRALHEVKYGKSASDDEEADAYGSEDSGIEEKDLYEGLDMGEDD